MAACGAARAEGEVVKGGCPDLPAKDLEVLKKLLAIKWAGKDFKGKGVAGTIAKANLDGFTGAWVKSDKTFEGVSSEDYTNYSKFMAEALKTDKTTKDAVNITKNADGTVSSFWWELKMGALISNRDMHVDIKKYKFPKDAIPDDMKVDEAFLWTDATENVKAGGKKVVRMKVYGFSFGVDTDKGYRMIDFDNYAFGGKLPTKIVNKFVGNPDDYVKMAADLARVKKNGGKW